MADFGEQKISIVREEPPKAPPAETDLAQKEALALGAKRDLEQEAKEKDHDRRESLRDVFHKIVVGALIAFTVAFFGGAIIVAYHMLLPVKWHWLDPTQLTELKTIGSAILLSSFVVEAGKKVLGKF